jgi:hypothetical protein
MEEVLYVILLGIISNFLLLAGITIIIAGSTGRSKYGLFSFLYLGGSTGLSILEGELIQLFIGTVPIVIAYYFINGTLEKFGKRTTIMIGGALVLINFLLIIIFKYILNN